MYLEPKWLQCLRCCSGLELIGPAHEELETLEVVLLSKEKAAAPHPSPEAGLAGGREAGLAGGLAGGLEAGVKAAGGML